MPEKGGGNGRGIEGPWMSGAACWQRLCEIFLADECGVLGKI